MTDKKEEFKNNTFNKKLKNFTLNKMSSKEDRLCILLNVAFSTRDDVLFQSVINYITNLIFRRPFLAALMLLNADTTIDSYLDKKDLEKSMRDDLERYQNTINNLLFIIGDRTEEEK